MKTFSEVMKITGISRSSLQRYAKIDMFKPSNQNELDKFDLKQRKIPWLYDDDTIMQLNLASLFSEIGYSQNKQQCIIE